MPFGCVRSLTRSSDADAPLSGVAVGAKKKPWSADRSIAAFFESSGEVLGATRLSPDETLSSILSN
jgi:hypothetical protein